MTSPYIYICLCVFVIVSVFIYIYIYIYIIIFAYILVFFLDQIQPYDFPTSSYNNVTIIIESKNETYISAKSCEI